MNRAQILDVITKALIAGVFFFVLQFYILKASLDTSLFWTIALGGGAGLLAWSQHTRGGLSDERSGGFKARTVLLR